MQTIRTKIPEIPEGKSQRKISGAEIAG